LFCAEVLVRYRDAFLWLLGEVGGNNVEQIQNNQPLPLRFTQSANMLGTYEPLNLCQNIRRPRKTLPHRGESSHHEREREREMAFQKPSALTPSPFSLSILKLTKVLDSSPQSAQSFRPDQRKPQVPHPSLECWSVNHLHPSPEIIKDLYSQ
jgi:hypothetical protein